MHRVGTFFAPARPVGAAVPACPGFPGFCVAPGCLPAPRVLGSLNGNWVPSGKKMKPWISDLEARGNRRRRPARNPPAKPAGRGPAWVPINGARGRGGHSAHPWPVPATRRLVAWFPGLLWEVLAGALGGQVRRIASAPTTQGGGGNPQTPSGKPPGAHPNSPGHRFWQLRRRVPDARPLPITT